MITRSEAGIIFLAWHYVAIVAFVRLVISALAWSPSALVSASVLAVAMGMQLFMWRITTRWRRPQRTDS